MTKLTKTTAFKSQSIKPETAMDKTTRVIKEMIDEETEKRQDKTNRLRNARLEREAHTPPKAAPVPRKPRASKTVAK